MNHGRTLHAATLELVSNLPLKQRLINAFTNHLQSLEPDHFHGALAADWARLHADLTAHRGVGREEAVVATVRKLSPSELEDLAGRIVRLYRDAAAAGPSLRMVENTGQAVAEDAQTLPLLFSAST